MTSNIFIHFRIALLLMVGSRIQTEGLAVSIEPDLFLANPVSIT
jgi:hypothetical protein